MIIQNDEWNSGIEDSIIRPIARKAIDLYADEVIENQEKKVEIDGYKVNMIRNNILNDSVYTLVMYPATKNSKYMINVEVGIPSGDTIRWFVGIFYMMKDGQWVDDRTLNKEPIGILKKLLIKNQLES